MPVETELAWAAGLFDGEGTLGAYPRKRLNGQKAIKWTIQARLAMVEHEPVRRFHEIVRVGTVNPRHIDKPNCRSQLEWQAGSNNVVRVLNKLMPYFVAKREQAELLLELVATFHRGRPLPAGLNERRISLAENIKSLKWRQC